MKWLSRIPSEIADAVALTRDERPLAWTTDAGGRHIVATEGDLILQRNPPAYDRIGWEAIDKASYADGMLSISLVPDGEGRVGRLQIPVGDDTKMAVVIRDRVTSSIVLNQHIALDGKHGLRVVARRRAGDEELRWGYVFDEGFVPSTATQASIDDLVEQVRLESGLA
ncbi:MAG TPA: hypothetical protein VMT88_09565 [Actinomycetes bacterium]|nr:hypothetical protein [Actinomycetes bacterium]